MTETHKVSIGIADTYVGQPWIFDLLEARYGRRPKLTPVAIRTGEFGLEATFYFDTAEEATLFKLKYG